MFLYKHDKIQTTNLKNLVINVTCVSGQTHLFTLVQGSFYTRPAKDGRRHIVVSHRLQAHVQKMIHVVSKIIEDNANTWWRHRIETFSVLLTFCDGNPPADSPHKGPVGHRALMFPLICAWTNRYSNNRDAGELRRHRAHYDVTAMRMFDTLKFMYLPAICSSESWSAWNKKINVIIYWMKPLVSIIHTPCTHDGVRTWKRFPYYWPFVRGIHRIPLTHQNLALPGIILGMGSANERWRYSEQPFLVGPAHTQNDSWQCEVLVSYLLLVDAHVTSPQLIPFLLTNILFI